MRKKRLDTASVVFALLVGSAPLLAQDAKDRAVEQYECKDVMRDSGANRDVAIAFLHGFLLGKSGSSKFNTEVLQRQTEAFIDRCLLNPTEKAVDVMAAIKK